MHVAVMQRHKRWKCGCKVDHINTCGCDNRSKNLRLVDSNMNGAHSGKQTNNTSGTIGVSWAKNRNKWETYIRVNGKRKNLGHYADIEDAIEARRQAEIKYFGKFQYDSTNVCPLGYTGQCPDCAARLKEME